MSSLVTDVLSFDIIRGAQPVRLRHIDAPHKAPCCMCGRSAPCQCADGEHLMCYCTNCLSDVWGEVRSL